VDEDDAGHASRFSGLLHVKVSQARVFQSGLKNGGGTTRMVHVTSSRRLRRVQAEDRRIDATDCVRPFYSNFAIFYVLVSRGILVFNFLLEPINRGTDCYASTISMQAVISSRLVEIPRYRGN
jgi:hypothetical protein